MFRLAAGLVRPVLSSVSISAWLVMLYAGQLHLPNPGFCGNAAGVFDRSGSFAATLAVAFADWPALLVSWMLMIAAMMTPTLAGPLLHLWHRSLARHRWRAIALFVGAYLGVWLTACAALVLSAKLLESLLRSPTVAGCLVAASGLAWQLSPARRKCLQRCHDRPRLSIFGAKAFSDPAWFGMTAAFWCVTTCWALMMLPFFWPALHLPLMAGATLIIVFERLSEPSGVKFARRSAWPTAPRHRLTSSLGS
jgi:predicted metal-binding membrane protein